MKQLLIILSLVLGSLQPGYAQKPALKFNKDGKFKIVQFTDVHYIHGNPKSAVSLERINEVLDAEKPDLVLFTGDVIYGQPAEEGMRTILNLAANRKIPFGVTFGNHDDEQGLTRTQLFDIIQTIPYNLTDSVAGVVGATNFILPLKSSDGKKDAAILYCLDSHSYSQIKGIGGYDYIKFEQREIHEAKWRHSFALAGILPHRPAGIQPGCIRRNSHLDRNAKRKSLRSTTELRYVRLNERNGGYVRSICRTRS